MRESEVQRALYCKAWREHRTEEIAGDSFAGSGRGAAFPDPLRVEAVSFAVPYTSWSEDALLRLEVAVVVRGNLRPKPLKLVPPYQRRPSSRWIDMGGRRGRFRGLIVDRPTVRWTYGRRCPRLCLWAGP